MLSQLLIENYRGIKNLELNQLGAVNIIAGANNTGKTSILEVLESLEGPNNLRLWRQIGQRNNVQFRPVDLTYDIVKSLFPLSIGEDNKRIAFTGVWDDEKFQVEIIAEEKETVITEQQFSEISGYRNGIVHEGEGEDNEYECNGFDIYN